MAHMALGVDIGGTKLAVARVDRDGRLTGRRTLSTPRDGTAEQLWDVLAGLVASVRRGDEVVVGVGCGGALEPGGGAGSPRHVPPPRGVPPPAPPRGPP